MRIGVHDCIENVQTIRYGSEPSQFVEVYEPRGDPTADTTVLIHGGYWRHRYGADLMHPLVTAFRKRGSTVVNLEYRRIGELPDLAWPDLSADVMAGIGFATELMPVSNATLTIVGHSAGGQLALWAATQTALAEQRAAMTVVALAPVADLIAADRAQLSKHVTVELLDGTADEVRHRYEQASPQERVPIGTRLVLVHGNHDEHVPVEQTTAFARAAQRAGDDVTTLLDPDIDHFDIINPSHAIWRRIFDLLDTPSPTEADVPD